MFTVRFHPGIAEFPAATWDALRARANPFVSHAFLYALERSGCIRPEWGWQPHHLGVYESGRLVAAAPLYLKYNSHGEYVFDWSWASAWERAGGSYYPKLLNAVPYSPVPGPRLLAGRDAAAPVRRRALVEAIGNETARLGLSSAHANFLDEQDRAAFGKAWLARSDVQFHWHNRDYRDFGDFLDALKAKKRKNIRQERTHVRASGLEIRMRPGSDLDEADWQQVHALYATTFAAKGNHATLTPAFFLALGELGETAQVATASEDGRMVAMALFVQDDATLYGRYWGTQIELPGLHFELCYYRGIEHAIARGLQRFEPGAQGEHKLARGFVPVRTHSRHYLTHPQFRAAVREALLHEARATDAYVAELGAHAPYAEACL